MHAVIEALEGKKAVIFGSNLEARRSETFSYANVILRRIQHRGQTKGGLFLMLAYQTVSVCEGLTALPLHIGSSIWPSFERERSGASYFVVVISTENRFSAEIRKTEWFYFYLIHVSPPASFSSKACTISTYLLLRSFYVSDSRSTAKMRDAPTVLSTRIKPHPEESPSRSASQKTWSSVGSHTTEESAACNLVIFTIIRSFLI